MDSENQVLFVLASQDFRDEEYSDTERVLSASNIGSKVAALAPGECVGTGDTRISVDYSFDEVQVADFAGIVLIGGTGVQEILHESSLFSVVDQFNCEGKVVAAICWAPAILANAGVLQGKKATVWEGAKKDLEKGGATYTGEAVTVDGNIITGNGPEAAETFAMEIVKRING